LVYISLDDLDTNLWRAVVELYLSDPLTHCYLMYDLIYELRNIEAVFSVNRGFCGAVRASVESCNVFGVCRKSLQVLIFKHIFEEINVNVASERLLRPNGVCDLLGVSYPTLRRWIKESRIRAVQTLGGKYCIIPESEVRGC